MTERHTIPRFALFRYDRLTPEEYGALLQFTHAVKCSKDMIGSRQPYPNTIGISEHSGRNTELLCVMPANDGCQYLFGIANLPQIDWSDKDTFPIFQLEAELGCKGPLTKWRDNEGHYR